MNKKIRIVVLKEDYLLKESLVNKINSNSDYEIIGIFDDGIKCFEVFDKSWKWFICNWFYAY